MLVFAGSNGTCIKLFKLCGEIQGVASRSRMTHPNWSSRLARQHFPVRCTRIMVKCLSAASSISSTLPKRLRKFICDILKRMWDSVLIVLINRSLLAFDRLFQLSLYVLVGKPARSCKDFISHSSTNNLKGRFAQKLQR